MKSAAPPSLQSYAEEATAQTRGFPSASLKAKVLGNGEFRYNPM
jgi:hypothetical protein